jgi:biotin carboxyl carrier protein
MLRLVIELMKMEMPVPAPGSGVVKEIKVNVGDTFVADAVLIVVE